jgi:hypothetical protein
MTSRGPHPAALRAATLPRCAGEGRKAHRAPPPATAWEGWGGGFATVPEQVS